MNTTYGYVRVSTKDQNEDRQIIAMHEFGVEDKYILVDKLSGKDFNRPAYQQMIRTIEPGDTLVLKSIDRLGRDYEEIIDQWRVITKDRQTAIVVLDMPLLDTRQKGKDLTGVFISDLVLQILSYVAQTEREFTHQRQREGIAAAKAKGVQFGRPSKERTDYFYQLKGMYEAQEISARVAAKLLGIHHKTFLRWVAE
ncbi:MAG: recombinase family protein [Oscillospiraceae bacterium]|nr:recombinase family protein [Oscillospiraceae bacterium]